MDRTALLESIKRLYEVSEHQSVAWLFWGFFYSRLSDDPIDHLDVEILSFGVDSLRRSGKIILIRPAVQLLDAVLANASTGGMELPMDVLERLNRARFSLTG